jgi:hypothetical protein
MTSHCDTYFLCAKRGYHIFLMILELKGASQSMSLTTCSSQITNDLQHLLQVAGISAVSSYTEITVHALNNAFMMNTKWAGWCSQNICKVTFGKCLVPILARTLAFLTEVFHGLPQMCQANSRTVHLLGHDQFLPYLYQFVNPFILLGIDCALQQSTKIEQSVAKGNKFGIARW